ncbi:hypothetical protein MTO96_013386 [Rhipicephalus appendiculatus]
MNNFVGHAVTGTFLFVFGTWWTFAAWLSYVRSRKNKQRYLCRCSYAVPGVNRKFSIEGMVKIISASVCIVADFSRIFRHDRSLNAESIQHHSIYAFFLLSGVVDVMYNVGFPFPPHADYAALLLAIASEGLMFHFHLQAEMCRPRSVLASLGRAYFCLLHGTWLWQLAFILFNPLPGYKPWNVNSHMDSMLAASLFPWHMMALLIYAGALGVAACVVNRMCGRFCAVVAADAEEVGDLREALLKCGV